jgi:hypothetical protein
MKDAFEDEQENDDFIRRTKTNTVTQMTSASENEERLLKIMEDDNGWFSAFDYDRI